MEEWPSISGVECGVHFEVRGSNIFFDEGGRAFRAYRDLLPWPTPPDFADPGYLQPNSKAKAAFRGGEIDVHPRTFWCQSPFCLRGEVTPQRMAGGTA